MTRRGFTLLEVMVAVAILGLGLTLILSSQAGLFASTRRIENDTFASNLLRCKMSELEVELEMKGFQLLDQHDSGECCEDEDTPGFSCDWKVETIELPLPGDLLNPEGDDKDGDKKTASSDGSGGNKPGTTPIETPEGDGTKGASSSPPAASGALGTLSILAGLKGSDKLVGAGKGPAGLASALGDSGGGGPQGIVSMAMTIVYPNLKPMLEASIRKVTVSVLWQDGERARDLTAVQYVTNPMEGSLSPASILMGDPALQAQLGFGSGATGAGTGTPSSGTTTTSPGSIR